MKRALLACAAALVLLASGCGASDNTQAVGGSQKATHEADPNFDQGQTITITNTGFEPAWLVAVVNRPITWVNETDRAVDLRFDNVGSDAPKPRIAPGETFEWRPTATVSVEYHDGASPKLLGKIQVEPEYMPGETPFTDSPSVPTAPPTA